MKVFEGFKEQFESYGFRYFNNSRRLHSTNHLYQCRIRDNIGTKYFIDIWYYDAASNGTISLPEGLQVEAMFYDRTHNPVCSIVLMREINSFEELLTEMEKMYNMLSVDGYYEYNQKQCVEE